MSARKKNTTTRPAKTTAKTTPQLATAAPALRTDSEKALWAALGNFPGFTAPELAGAAGISASTTRRILSGWATTGVAHRDRDPDNRRTAEHWSPATPATTATSPEPAEPTQDATNATESDDIVAAADPVPHPHAAPNRPVDADTGVEATAPATDTSATDPDVAAAPQKSSHRLAPGALRGEVEDHLRDAPGKEFTPHEIGKSLGRSSGAVHNALVKLTVLGTARQTCTRPKKFALVPGH